MYFIKFVDEIDLESDSSFAENLFIVVLLAFGSVSVRKFSEKKRSNGSPSSKPPSNWTESARIWRISKNKQLCFFTTTQRMLQREQDRPATRL